MAGCLHTPFSEPSSVQPLLVTAGTSRPVSRLRVQIAAKIFPFPWLSEFLPLPPPTESCWVTGSTTVLMPQCLRATYGRNQLFQERHLRQSQEFLILLLAAASSPLLEKGIACLDSVSYWRGENERGGMFRQICVLQTLGRSSAGQPGPYESYSSC